MKGGIAPRVIRNPLTPPAAAPAPIHPSRQTGQGSGKLSTSRQPTTPDNASTEPAERSMPAEEMTKVAPIASTPITDVASRMLSVLEIDRK